MRSLGRPRRAAVSAAQQAFTGRGLDNVDRATAYVAGEVLAQLAEAHRSHMLRDIWNVGTVRGRSRRRGATGGHAVGVSYGG